MSADLTEATWRKSTRSNGSDQCVEVADNLPGVIAVRDSKGPQGPSLRFTPDNWSAFVTGLKTGRFDLA